MTVRARIAHVVLDEAHQTRPLPAFGTHNRPLRCLAISGRPLLGRFLWPRAAQAQQGDVAAGPALTRIMHNLQTLSHLE